MPCRTRGVNTHVRLTLERAAEPRPDEHPPTPAIVLAWCDGFGLLVPMMGVCDLRR